MEKYTKQMLQENNRRRKQVLQNVVPDFNHKNSIVYNCGYFNGFVFAGLARLIQKRWNCFWWKNI
jgi:hypothetical protein